ncbi:MAG: hypothetical protein PGN34_12845 [Methylobacterium frigidaeris]
MTLLLTIAAGGLGLSVGRSSAAVSPGGASAVAGETPMVSQAYWHYRRYGYRPVRRYSYRPYRRYRYYRPYRRYYHRPYRGYRYYRPYRPYHYRRYYHRPRFYIGF